MTSSVTSHPAPTIQHLIHARGRREAGGRAGPSLEESLFLFLLPRLQSTAFILVLEGGTGSSGCRGLCDGLCHHGLSKKWTGSGDCRYLGCNSTVALASLMTSKNTVFMAAQNLFPLPGVNETGFCLQNKPALSSNKPVFPAHTYSKCAHWIKGSVWLLQCGRCCFAQKSMKKGSFFKRILQFSSSQIKH